MYVRRHPELWLWMHRRWRDDGRVDGRRAGDVSVGGRRGVDAGSDDIAESCDDSASDTTLTATIRTDRSLAAIGIRQPVPNARSVTFRPAPPACA